MRLIQLTMGQVAIVDDTDYEILCRFRWFYMKAPNRIGYAYRRQYVGQHRFTVRMHRELLGAAPGIDVDHRNGNGLDNRRTNLRTCTAQKNAWNARPIRSYATSPVRSRFKGVIHDPGGCLRPWRARILIRNKRRHLGRFATEEQAAEAYDAAAMQHFGEFARLNFPAPAQLAAAS